MPVMKRGRQQQSSVGSRGYRIVVFVIVFGFVWNASAWKAERT